MTPLNKTDDQQTAPVLIAKKQSESKEIIYENLVWNKLLEVSGNTIVVCRNGKIEQIRSENIKIVNSPLSSQERGRPAGRVVHRASRGG